jgi:SAM-dependent methyltransferase
MNRWDDRYRPARYFYGTAPNDFVAAALRDLPRGRGLFLAEGEGRNAVHAARLGHEVVAVDSSREGRRKALALAAAHDVALTYHLADARSFPFETESWDFVVLCFFQLIPGERPGLHARVATALKPGGRLVVQAFAREQLGRPSGGPPDAELLYDLATLRDDFPGVRWELARAGERELAEGVGHRGPAAVIEMLGVKQGPARTGLRR